MLRNNSMSITKFLVSALIFFIITLTYAKGDDCILLSNDLSNQSKLQNLLIDHDEISLKEFEIENDPTLGEKIQNYNSILSGSGANNQINNNIFLKENSDLFGVIINQYVYYLWTIDIDVNSNKSLFLKYYKVFDDFSKKFCILNESNLIHNLLELKYLGLQERTIYNQSEIVAQLRRVVLYIKETSYLQIYLDNIISSKNFVFSQEVDYWQKTSNSEEALCNNMNKRECVDGLRKLIINLQKKSGYSSKVLSADDHIVEYFCTIRIVYKDRIIELNRCV
ncbi:MAG: hypothetical protein ABJJ37_05615 [Roseibium sp.]